MKKIIAAIIQARTGSSRLPRKVLADLNGKPLIEFLIERVKKCSDIDEIILATTFKKEDDILENIASNLKIKCVRGSKDDVLSRYVKATEETKAQVLIRLTGDCPFLDPELISRTINEFKLKNVDYLSNCYPPSYPDGLDVEVFSRNSLLLADKFCRDTKKREHVTPWIRESGEFKLGTLRNNIDLSNLRWTVDEPEDLLVARKIAASFPDQPSFNWKDILELNNINPGLFEDNKKYIRNEGSNMDSGQKLWRRAKRVIPGGNMLLSKRPEMFLPEKWPCYFSRAKDCYVWDLDDRKLIDMSIMGIGTNILGYGNEEVDNSVLNTVKAGNMSTLNCPEEVFLAERLIELHPWSNMARFARSGGEANAIAVRIARASTGKDKIAICGYHGWHDWYLATNLKYSEGLQKHLLPGLAPTGVPKSLGGSVIPFDYNNFDELLKLSNKYDLAAVKMEVERSVPPSKDFLDQVRDLCTRKGIILIFDECTSGFRETFGGLHLKYGVNPDMAIFGKALGNGYAISAVIGKGKIMDAAQDTFISSTFWTERIGPTAALKTLEIMEIEKSWDLITLKGQRLRENISKLAKKYDLNIKFNGILSLTGFTIISNNSFEYKTFISQEMLKKGFLASNLCYLCTKHTEEIMRKYIKELEPIFHKIAECEDGRNILDLLEVPVCQSGFKRLN